MDEHLSHLKKQEKNHFVTNIEMESFPKGLNENIVRSISEKRNEPQWLLKKRLRAFKHWQTLKEPHWGCFHYKPIDYQDICYYSAPKSNEGPKSLNELDPELLKTFERLGIPLQEQKRISGVAVDAVFDSVSVGTTHQEILEEKGIIFCSISEAVQNHPRACAKILRNSRASYR